MFAPIPTLSILSSTGTGNSLEVRGGRGGREDNEFRIFVLRHCHGEFYFHVKRGKQLRAKIFLFLLCEIRSSGCFLLIDVRDSQLSLLQLLSVLVRHVCSLFLLSFLRSLSRKRRSSVVVSARGLMCALLLFTLKCLIQLEKL